MHALMQGWDASMLQAAALGLLALAVLVVGVSMAMQQARRARNQRVVDEAVATRADPAAARAERATRQHRNARAVGQAVDRAVELGGRWGQGRLGSLVMAEEDRRLVDMAGYEQLGRARALFIFARLVLAAGLPLAGLLLLDGFAPLGNRMLGWICLAFFGFGLGWMLPKWAVQRRVSQRKRAAAEELPLLIDLLRLLQGVGLSMDQSLHVVVNEFRQAMPVLAAELKVAVEQYARGRTREQSLARLANGFGNDDLGAICRLIAQVDRHGGAVQEPLQRFSERVRERRKLELKENVGRLTVKMTGVMVLTLLPALLIVTGGAGFLAVIRGLSRVAGAS
ncbi:type II secretion system F family protein [Orrella sp. JC864]|uniref:type II secretion system F family protein n=1 Tax=Orrella sp. JC864 TaxID=3120298 RepID=UPI00300ABF56